MTPDQITAALRDFAAASAQSPDPARSVSELALLIAHLFDQARLAAEAESAGAAPIGPGEFDELAFPPVDNLPAPADLTEVDQAALDAGGLTIEQFAQLPDTEREHLRQVAAQLAQRQLEG